MQPICAILLSSTGNEFSFLIFRGEWCLLWYINLSRKISNKTQLELIVLATNLDGCISKLPVRRVLCLPIELQMTYQSIIFNEPDLSKSTL
jgi:hypothetical protein